MNGLKALELIRKYAACKDCGNDKVGGGQGKLEVEDDVFRRSCKCGWSIEIKE